MSAAAKARTRSFALPAAEGGVAHYVLSLLLGAVFTLGLFLGIAHYEKTAPAAPPTELEDLRIAVLSVPPPPLPPTNQTEAVVEVVPMAGFDLSPSSSPVKIAVSPPALRDILPEELSKAPSPHAVVGPLLTDFKPKMDIVVDAQHVFQRSEVDRGPAVLDRVTDEMARYKANGVRSLRVHLLVVINTDGLPSNIRLVASSGDPSFDARALEDMKTWIFSPALKAGKKVRCLIQQSVTVKFSGRSPFSL